MSDLCSKVILIKNTFLGPLVINFNAPTLGRHMNFPYIIIFSITTYDHWTNYIFYLFVYHSRLDYKLHRTGIFVYFVLCSIPGAWHILGNQ